MHAAHPTVGVSIAQPIQVFTCPVIRTPKVQAVLDPKDHLQATRLENYLADYLGNNYTHYSIDWRCSAIKTNGPCADEILSKDSDCLVLFGHPRVMDKNSLCIFGEHVANGGSLVGVRVADYALHGMADFAKQTFHGEYMYEHLLAPATLTPAANAKNHPLLRGVSPFILPGGIHRYHLLQGEAAPVLYATICGESIPVAWVRTQKGRRIFATTLGSNTDFRHPCFLRLLANAILWTSR